MNYRVLITAAASAAFLLTSLSVRAAGNITNSMGMPPDAAASFSKTMAKSRVNGAVSLPQNVLINEQELSRKASERYVNTNSQRECVTNVGTTTPPAVGSGTAFGPIGATRDNTVVVRGDIINVCR
jgi:hypothetical protein